MHFPNLLLMAALASPGAASPVSSSCPPDWQGNVAAPGYTSSLPICPVLQNNGVALTRSEIAQIFTSHTVPVDDTAAADMELIRRTISRYALAIDGRNFPVLDSIFTQDALANYSEVGFMSGIQEIKATLSAALTLFAMTQHLMGTSVIQLCREEQEGTVNGSVLSAVSATYVLATHFPAPSTGWPGVISPEDIAVVPVMYQDSWTREVDCHGAVAWKIRGRYLLYQGLLIGSVPNQSIGLNA
ncbi:uncharacterized protein B0I36DRAFT_319191 [Microdochium trichocladiopsis]|uniref:SnoaL-like domain-containing protein n=1 Tax=Microdochium trichocladiopsis TaxID=1682393 RepID=A0A9P8YA28_9PEZI|nr:uncharacterized protein B0I36DRAFT_319191 [Microdochium trichocladiopsis]KAH7035839.1 hypothetical protein B0I36DRAFT_319191 [Microdochium trichocladiopsis]